MSPPLREIAIMVNWPCEYSPGIIPRMNIWVVSLDKSCFSETKPAKKSPFIRKTNIPVENHNPSIKESMRGVRCCYSNMILGGRKVIKPHVHSISTRWWFPVRGYPQSSSILTGFPTINIYKSSINHPLWDEPPFVEPPMCVRWDPQIGGWNPPRDLMPSGSRPARANSGESTWAKKTQSTSAEKQRNSGTMARARCHIWDLLICRNILYNLRS